MKKYEVVPYGSTFNLLGLEFEICDHSMTPRNRDQEAIIAFDLPALRAIEWLDQYLEIWFLIREGQTDINGFEARLSEITEEGNIPRDFYAEIAIKRQLRNPKKPPTTHVLKFNTNQRGLFRGLRVWLDIDHLSRKEIWTLSLLVLRQGTTDYLKEANAPAS